MTIMGIIAFFGFIWMSNTSREVEGIVVLAIGIVLIVIALFLVYRRGYGWWERIH